MLFTTLSYAAFFLGVFAVHGVLPRPLRRPWLLVASYVFYIQAIPQYGLLIGAMTLVNYTFGLALQRRDAKSTKMLKDTKAMKQNALRELRSFHDLRVSSSFIRKALLVLAVGLNLATLAFFKYAAFLLDAVWPLAKTMHAGAQEPALNIILPLGISFFTFEFIHYVVEVYRGQPPMVNPIDFALFAAFFPTQIAGPIKRFPDWVKQIRHPTPLREIKADAAIGLILRGMAKKILVADLLAPVVAQGFARPDRLGWLATWFVIYAFAAQIYADFSGYTDIGRGCAMLLGYGVPENFNRPYQARDVGEFWERWHISLSQWLRDYLFIPLGGSRCALWRVCLNLMITMALGGLWHGASWHFMVWGIYQGGLLVAQRLWVRGEGWARAMMSARRERQEQRVSPHDARRRQRVSPRDARREQRASLHDARRGLKPPGSEQKPLRAVGMQNRSRHRVLVGQVLTFHLVCLGWVLFRAETGPLAWTLITFALHPMRHNFTAGFQWFAPGTLALPGMVLATGAALVISGWLRTWASAGGAIWQGMSARWGAWQARWEPILRPVGYLALLLLIAIWPQGEAQRFIYFQF